MSKMLRFAALCRVSTEGQEDRGESLRTQRTHIERDMGILEGHVVTWYGGAEHATPGYETGEVARLIADAAKGKFDAVIVAHADRWSRGNQLADQGLEQFKDKGVRFYVSTTEYQLHNPEHRLFLGMSSVFGRFQADNQNKKSILSRIHRAKRGLPVSGKLPYGRTFNPDTGKWGIDPAKQRIIEDAAKRYLDGEALPKIAEEYGMNHSSLHVTLTKRAGTEWVQTFDCPNFKIKEDVPTVIPALLDEKTIKDIHDRVAANKTYHHGQLKNAYLLSRMVFCAHCGYAMFGQTNHGNRRYYRHHHLKRVKECPHPEIWVYADDLEAAVFGELFSCFGNPAAVQRAIDAAIPNREQVEEYRQRQQRLTEDLHKIKEARERVLRMVTKGTIDEAEGEKELNNLKYRATRHAEELERLAAALANTLTPDDIQRTGKQVAKQFGKYAGLHLQAKIAGINLCPDDVTWEDRRALAELVFSGKMPDGRRMGVFVHWNDGQEGRQNKRWTFRIVGHFIDTWSGSNWRLVPEPEDAEDLEIGSEIGAPHQKRLMAETKFGNGCTGPGPPALLADDLLDLRGNGLEGSPGRDVELPLGSEQQATALTVSQC